jgi:prepilin-type N-terminal cleavage/methylation domain-containing protein
MTKKRGFTLVEILVVVSIIALVAGLTIPAIKAMQAGSARAEALNTINAALQGVRSYAIMNQVKAAARFQPNGKVVFVYRFEGNGNSRYRDIDSATGSTLYLDSGIGVPNAGGYIYLPVLDQEPLKMPNGYAAAPVGGGGRFYEPFYVCYNPDGTLAVGEEIWVAMIVSTANRKPINPNFDNTGGFAWEPSPFTSTTYDRAGWLTFLQSQNDAANTHDVNDRKLARFFIVAVANNAAFDSELEAIFDTGDLGIDHYAGSLNTTTPPLNPFVYTGVTSIRLFKTPEDWGKLSLHMASPPSGMKTKTIIYENDILPRPDMFEQVYINPYTGRIIRANQ